MILSKDTEYAWHGMAACVSETQQQTRVGSYLELIFWFLDGDKNYFDFMMKKNLIHIELKFLRLKKNLHLCKNEL